MRAPPPNDVQPENQALVPAPGYVDVSAYPASSVPVGGSASQVRRYLTFLKKKWWIPLLSVLFFGGLAAAYVAWWPASYVATARMWSAGRMGFQLREGTISPEDNTTFAGTQIELIQSDLIRGRAFNRAHNALHINFPTNSEGNIKLPTVKVSQLPTSALHIAARRR